MCEYILEESQMQQSFKILLEVKGLEDTIQPYILVHLHLHVTLTFLICMQINGCYWPSR